MQATFVHPATPFRSSHVTATPVVPFRQRVAEGEDEFMDDDFEQCISGLNNPTLLTQTPRRGETQTINNHQESLTSEVQGTPIFASPQNGIQISQNLDLEQEEEETGDESPFYTRTLTMSQIAVSNFKYGYFFHGG